MFFVYLCYNLPGYVRGDCETGIDLVMREEYWNMYVSMKHKTYYFKHYSILLYHINWVIIGVCTLFSVTSITTWLVWRYIPWAWGILTAFVQVLQFLHTFMPFTKRATALQYMLSQLDTLMIEMEHDWRTINIEDYQDPKISKLIKGHKRTYSNLSIQFTSDISMPYNKLCDKKAEKECKNFFFYYYNL